MNILQMKRKWRAFAVKHTKTYSEASALYATKMHCGLSTTTYYAELRRIGRGATIAKKGRARRKKGT